LEITDANDYYPFGMNHLKTGNAYFAQGNYKAYKYNGKELQETGMYSYGWREYMPDIGRWNGIDQLAESYLSTSTYAYVANNPVSNADVDGRWFNNDGSIDVSGTANGFVSTRSYAQSYLGQNSQQGGGSAEVIAKMIALGGDWYNTGYGFAGTAKIGLAYDGSYTSLNTDLDGYINIPEITLSGSSFFWGKQAQDHFNSYMKSWNSRSDFLTNKPYCGHCNDGPIQYVGGAGDFLGIWEVGGMALSGATDGRANYIMAALMVTRSGNTGGALKLLNAEKGILAAEGGVLPMQIHHFATNKNKTFTPDMEKIAAQFNLKLDDIWNKEAMPHLGRHPNNYHTFVLEEMQKAAKASGGSQAKFLELFNKNVKQPVLKNPELLRKSGWK
ncbi:RHS repeat-associated core domain-containing protein, partial [uncultured Chryseobacterium sp.]|uniref:RHS repeat-associated core domain-containing protein n=1 Tax=uncultured Chryseobacterium sp. TaxID=259322 RepID=UPI0025CF12C7